MCVMAEHPKAASPFLCCPETARNQRKCAQGIPVVAPVLAVTMAHQVGAYRKC